MAKLTKEEVAKRAKQLARAERKLTETVISNSNTRAAMREEEKKQRDKITGLAFEVEKEERYVAEDGVLPGMEETDGDDGE